jgi:predicted amidohydrolase
MRSRHETSTPAASDSKCRGVLRLGMRGAALLPLLCALSSAILGAMAASAEAASIRVVQSSFKAGESGLPEGWKVWGARPEITPRAFVDNIHFREHAGSLALSGNGNAAAYGGWEYAVPGVEPGKWYRLSAYYRAVGLRYESQQVLARLDWTTSTVRHTGQPHDGRSVGRAGKPDYAYKVTRGEKWNRVLLEAPAPPQADSVIIQLYLANAPEGTLWWDDISLVEIPPPSPRLVTVATIKYEPHDTRSASENVRQFLEVARKAVTGKVDVVLFPEGMTVADTGKEYYEVAESVPGPTTARLGEFARRKNAYVAAGLFERVGPAVYNTAVLIDRKGELVGKYHKVYLPGEEVEDGLTPGSEYPVFQTDFGVVGLMICWDARYADPARALALKGAEIILMPIWDGNPTLTQARAIENQVFLVTSSYGDPSLILDPDGNTQAAATQEGTAAIATLDLNHPYGGPHGNLRERFMKELRLDVQVRRPEPVR